jgi:hypothetical protein
MKNIKSKRIRPNAKVLELVKQLGRVSAACKTMGCSRDNLNVLRSGMRMVAKTRCARSAARNRSSATAFQSMLNWRLKPSFSGQLRVSQDVLQRSLPT